MSHISIQQFMSLRLNTRSRMRSGKSHQAVPHVLQARGGLTNGEQCRYAGAIGGQGAIGDVA